MGRITTVDQKQIFDFPIDIIVAYYSVIGKNNVARHCKAMIYWFSDANLHIEKQFI